MNTPVVLQVGRLSMSRRRLPARRAAIKHSSARTAPTAGAHRPSCSGIASYCLSLALESIRLTMSLITDAHPGVFQRAYDFCLAKSSKGSPYLGLLSHRGSIISFNLDACGRAGRYPGKL